MKITGIKYITIILFFILFDLQSLYAFKLRRTCIRGNDIILYWYNNIDTCNQFISYSIFARENPTDAYKLITTITDFNQTEFLHLNAITKSTNWRYYIKTSISCGGSDSVFSDSLDIDKTPPADVLIDSISVINGKTTIGWKPSKAKDVKGYVIYYVDNNLNNIVIDTVFGKFNTIYTDKNTGSPSAKSEKYKIAAIDSCDNTTIISNSHNSVFLTVTQDSCKQELHFTWNKYSSWNDKSCSYKLYLSNDQVNYSLLDTAAAGQTNYTYKTAQTNNNYYFFLRVFNYDSGFSSTSNVIHIRTHFTTKAKYIYVKNATVEQSKIRISWVIDTIADIKNIKIYRRTDIDPTTLYQTVVYNYMLQDDYIDPDVDVKQSHYYYFVESEDVCGNVVKSQNEAGNILLISGQEQSNYWLKWNRYATWSGGIEIQTIFETQDTNSGWNKLADISSTETIYNENLSQNDLKGKEICYYLEAKEGNSNIYGFKEISKSNLVCIEGDPTIYIPNAFVPLGTNNKFKPEGTRINFEESEMFIYSRWGQLMWYKMGIVDGWDGRNDKKELLPGGVYYYYLKIKGSNNVTQTFNGSLTLIR